MRKKYDVKGMGCAACSARVEKCVGALAGVQTVEVNLLANSMVVNYDDKICSSEDIMNRVSEAGYEAAEEDEEVHRKGAGEITRENCEELKRRLIISIAFAVPLFYVAMGHVFGWPLPAPVSDGAGYYVLQMVLVAPVVIVNFKYFDIGFRMIGRRSPNMDSLVAVGCTAAIIMLYFESAGMILTLVTLGKYLEAVAKGKTTDAIEKLVMMVPEEATIVVGSEEKRVSVEQIKTGDLVVVNAGERIPVDGIVTEGSAKADESAITGESRPVEKREGDEVCSATINLEGRIVFRTTRVGEDAIQDMEEMGLDVIMLTGDKSDRAEQIRAEVGIDRVFAEVRPGEKDRIVAELQEKEGRIVAMVGDGINDAPAITRADVGIAIGSGTDIAMDSADIVLVRSDLKDVSRTIRLSSKVMRTIKQNLFWALCYNVVCIPVAAGVLYPFTGWLLDPMIGAACMSLSSVCVVGNALRLKRVRL